MQRGSIKNDGQIGRKAPRTGMMRLQRIRNQIRVRERPFIGEVHIVCDVGSTMKDKGSSACQHHPSTDSTSVSIASRKSMGSSGISQDKPSAGGALGALELFGRGQHTVRGEKSEIVPPTILNLLERFRHAPILRSPRSTADDKAGRSRLGAGSYLPCRNREASVQRVFRPLPRTSARPRSIRSDSASPPAGRTRPGATPR
ncbi:hypothetical protein BH11ARM2_BH11ARM2_16500 [soil metagenome]